ncbi:MAG: HAMP domain-containing protein [Deltaproteobacteria bacterium]|nr:MAG: HAMP domain-containing protein [Deltaproteobacteria bacterium]
MGDATEHSDSRAPRGGDPPLAFKRLFVVPGVAITLAEAAAVVWPALALFDLPPEVRAPLSRAAIPLAAGALAIWFASIAAWLHPVQRAVAVRRRGEPLPKPLASRAYRATFRAPLRVLLLRVGLWAVVSAIAGAALVRAGAWGPRDVGHLVGMVCLHAFAVNLGRAAWYGAILRSVRERLFPEATRMRVFADGYFGRLALVALGVAGGASAAASAFVYFFVRLPREQFLELQALLPLGVGGATAALVGLARYWTRPIDRYLRDDGGEPTRVYRRAQELPYRLALATIGLWAAAAAAITVTARYTMDLDSDDAVLLFGVTVVLAVGAALYQALWHRETMRPLLAHLTVRHRLPLRRLRSSLSLRAKLLTSFGGVVAFACGLALLWGFIQYKNLVTGFVGRQAELGMAWLRSEVQAAIASAAEPPTPAAVERVLLAADAATPARNAVVYFEPTDVGARPFALGGGPMGAPRLPWYARARMRLGGDGPLEVGSLGLTGVHGRLRVQWRGEAYDLGAIAVLFPAYSGRGPSIERPLKELLVFFVVLFGVCGGIAVLTVREFVQPVRELQQRADAMARGELAKPVTSSGESDEIGRLTFALEEMRRALGEKLRSTEEVNLDLERAVQRRTADLAKKNRELAETLEKLTRAQSQLVRSEKMASIGQLVAGIAHEINNPVNAIVNTVGPLDDAIAALGDVPEADEMRQMIRVIQRGANRTKDIVRALHNYSRTDDESVVDVDLNRSLDDSLELLRHLLKGGIRVERSYGDVGRIRGHAGQLNQVFMNLLTNAAQAVAHTDGAEIRVSTDATPDAVVVRVSDNGPGIPPDVLPRIFDPFFTTKDVGEGTGLGLSIVHGIVERHGGTIEVDSAPGKGTTFTVTLPRGDVGAYAQSGSGTA